MKVTFSYILVHYGMNFKISKSKEMILLNYTKKLKNTLKKSKKSGMHFTHIHLLKLIL